MREQQDEDEDDLPLADQALPALAIVAVNQALVRVDERRWDIRLKDGSIILLPAVDEGSALIELDLLDRRDRILEAGLDRIDLREPGAASFRRRQADLISPPAAKGV